MEATGIGESFGDQGDAQFDCPCECKRMRNIFNFFQNNVTYQPVPSLEETLAQLPPPALMVTTKPYNLPEMVAVVMKAAGKKTEEEEGA